MTSLKSLSVGGYALMVVGLVPLIFFKGILSLSPIVIVVQILAVFLMIWARVTFGSRSFHFAANPTQGGLVTTGPYRYIRHPIYASVLYFGVVGVIPNWSLANVLLVGLLCIGVAIRIYCEERLVVQQYPEYSEYSKRTKRIIPFLL